MKRTKTALAILLVILIALPLSIASAAVDDGTACPNDPEGVHDWQQTGTQEATCVSAAKELYQCANCGKTYSISTGAAPLGHDFQVNGKMEPTCTEPGYEHYICVRCKMDGGVMTLPALGHSWGDWQVIVPPTCTEGGYSEHVCTGCGLTEKGQETAALGHDYRITDSKAPTYTEDGYNTYVCQNNADHTYTEVVPMLTHSHDYQEKVTVAPTCTEDGTLTYTCSLCGDSYTKVSPALGHDWSEWEPVKAVTCTEDGVETRICKNDASHVETRTVAALGHDWGDWVTTQTANCGREGIRTKTCKRDASHVLTETIPIKGSHDWTPWTVETPGTCVKKEMRRRWCYNCGKEDYSYGAYGDHDWGEWLTITPATETGIGIEQRVCKNNSSHKEQREITPLVSSDEAAEILAFLEITWDPDIGKGKMNPGDQVSMRYTITNTADRPLYFDKGDPTSYIQYQVPHEVEDENGARFYLEPGETATFICVHKVTDEDVKAGMVHIDACTDGHYFSVSGEWVAARSNQITVDIPLTK